MTGKSTTPSSYFHRLKGLSIVFVYHTFYKTIQDYSIVYTRIIHYKHVTRGSFESNYQYCYYFNRYEVQWGTNQSIRMILPQLNKSLILFVIVIKTTFCVANSGT